MKKKNKKKSEKATPVKLKGMKMHKINKEKGDEVYFCPSEKEAERIEFSLRECVWLLDELTKARDFIDGGRDVVQLSELIGLIRGRLNLKMKE